MKNIFLILLISFAHKAVAQMTFTDSTNNLTATVYAGILGGPKTSVIDTKTEGQFYGRLGGTLNWQPKKWLSMYSLLAGEIDHTASVTPFCLYGVKFFPQRKLSTIIGKVPSPMTEMRPLPTTGAGQFEPWVPSQIPGSAIGGKITFRSKNFSIVSGAFRRGNEASLEAKTAIGKFEFGSYYLTRSKLWGSAFQFNSSNFSTTLEYNQSKSLGALFIAKVPGSKMQMYLDSGYSLQTEKIVRTEFGIFRDFESKYLHILWGLGYANELKSFKGYLFMHL